MTEWMAKARKTIKRSLWTTVPIPILAILVPILAICIPGFIPEGETVGSWFQRSGAIVVALSVWTEIKNNVISGYIYPSGVITNDYDLLKKDYGLYFNLIKWVGFILAILGTLIWGYGDIPFKNT